MAVCPHPPSLGRTLGEVNAKAAAFGPHRKRAFVLDSAPLPCLGSGRLPMLSKSFEADECEVSHPDSAHCCLQQSASQAG